MAECKIPVRIDGYKCVEDMAQAVLNYTYKGKTLKEWADSISEPQTNADRIRAMTDGELADVIKNPCDMGLHIPNEWCKKRNCGYQCSLDWLKQEAKE